MKVRIQGGADYSTARNADLLLNSYVTTPSNNWQDIYIPASAFTAAQPAIDLTHVWDIALLATGSYTDH